MLYFYKDEYLNVSRGAEFKLKNRTLKFKMTDPI